MNPQPKPGKRPKAPRAVIRKRPKPRRKANKPAPEYLAFVRSLPCWIGEHRRPALCIGPIEADHTTTRGAGGGDMTAVPLCSAHHRERHALAGAFAGMNKFMMFAWKQRAVADTLAKWLVRETADLLLAADEMEKENP